MTDVTCVEWFVIWFVYKCVASLDKWCGTAGNDDGGSGSGMLFWKVSDWWLQVWKERKWHQSINNVTNILSLYNRNRALYFWKLEKMLVQFLGIHPLVAQLNTSEFHDKIMLFICRRRSHSMLMMFNIILNVYTHRTVTKCTTAAANRNYLKTIMK